MFSPGVIQAVVRHTSFIRHNTAPACLCALFATVTTAKAYLCGAPTGLICSSVMPQRGHESYTGADVRPVPTFGRSRRSARTSANSAPTRLSRACAVCTSHRLICSMARGLCLRQKSVLGFVGPVGPVRPVGLVGQMRFHPG